MLKPLLINLGAAHAWRVIGVILSKILILLQQKFYNKRSKTCRIIEGEDRISALPDDLLVEILLYLPTKDAVVTMFLSKRWRFVWTMMPYLVYNDNDDVDEIVVTAGLLERFLNRLIGKSNRKPRCIWRFLNESLRLHKAEVLEYISIQLGQHCPIDVDVQKLITNIVNRKVEELGFKLSWCSKPITLPNCFYTCDTLVYLGLYDKILVDVPSNLACLFPSLEGLGLRKVVYKDDESLVRLLSSCPILKDLIVKRHQKDKVTNFIIKVPSLECLLYEYDDEDDEYLYGTLVIDSPALKKIFITDYSGNSCSIEGKPHVDKAIICVHSYPGYKFMTSLASLMYLELSMNFATVAFCNDINFSKLLECRITLVAHEFNWLEPLMSLLQNSPNLKTILIDQSIIGYEEEFSLSWNEPSCVPRCLSEHLEIFEWKGYEGRSIKEKEMVKYIFANSKCLKRAGISLKSSTRKRTYKMRKQLKAMHRSSTSSSQLLFSTQLGYMNIRNEMSD